MRQRGKSVFSKAAVAAGVARSLAGPQGLKATFVAMDETTPMEVTINVSQIELMTLKKLSLVSHALASKLDFRAQHEQMTLATVLDDVIRRIELAAVTPTT